MASQFPSRSDWSAKQAQSGRAERSGPRGAGWVVAALYLFCALVLTSWAEGWGEEDYHAAAPPAQHEHAPRG